MTDPQLVGTLLFGKYKSSVKHLSLLNTLLMKNSFLVLLHRERIKNFCRDSRSVGGEDGGGEVFINCFSRCFTVILN